VRNTNQNVGIGFFVGFSFVLKYIGPRVAATYCISESGWWLVAFEDSSHRVFGLVLPCLVQSVGDLVVFLNFEAEVLRVSVVIFVPS